MDLVKLVLSLDDSVREIKNWSGGIDFVDDPSDNFIEEENNNLPCSDEDDISCVFFYLGFNSNEIPFSGAGKTASVELEYGEEINEYDYLSFSHDFIKSPNGEWLQIVYRDGKTRLYFENGEEFREYGIHEQIYRFIKFKDEWLLAASDGNKVMLYDKEGSLFEKYGREHDFIYKFVEINNKLFLGALDDKKLCLYSEDGNKIYSELII